MNAKSGANKTGSVSSSGGYQLHEYPGFLNQSQCNRIIELGLPNLKPAGVLGEQQKDFRVADTTFFDNSLAVLKRIKEVIATHVKIPVENQEAMSIIRYFPGGEFKAHNDAFHKAADYFSEVMSQGGQRVKTALIYLNDDFEGGETEFPNIGRRIKPETGKLVIFDNVDPAGEILPESLHAGMPVTSGTKYLATIWIRERKFAQENSKAVKY